MNPLDQKIVEPHYQSRSQAVFEMINKYLIIDHPDAGRHFDFTL